jgi:hypothetical protein
MLMRWLQVPEFDAAYRKARRDAFAQSTGRLQQASSAAVTTLLRVMTDVNAPAACRVRAADSVLAHSRQFPHDAVLKQKRQTCGGRFRIPGRIETAEILAVGIRRLRRTHHLTSVVHGIREAIQPAQSGQRQIHLQAQNPRRVSSQSKQPPKLIAETA